jgi:hypothetical protein
MGKFVPGLADYSAREENIRVGENISSRNSIFSSLVINTDKARLCHEAIASSIRITLLRSNDTSSCETFVPARLAKASNSSITASRIYPDGHV